MEAAGGNKHGHPMSAGRALQTGRAGIAIILVIGALGACALALRAVGDEAPATRAVAAFKDIKAPSDTPASVVAETQRVSL